MSKNKKSFSDGESKGPPFLEFCLCAKACLVCAYCGWHWGPSHPTPGAIPYWISRKETA